MPASASGDVGSRLLSFARQQPDAPALQAPGLRPMTWGSLGGRIQAEAARLAAWSIGRGHVVAAAMPDRATGAALLAVLPAAATLAMLDPSLAPEAYVALLRRLRPKALIVPARGTHALEEAGRRLGIATVEARPDASGEAGGFELRLSRPTPSLDADVPCRPAWAYVGVTSGTTGRPKLVPHGHAQVLATAQAMGERLAMTPADVSAHLTPLHLANGQRTAFLLSMLNGGSVRCLPEADASALLGAIDADEVSYVSASFAIQRELVERFRTGTSVRSSRLRFVRVASGRLEPDEFAALEVAFGVPVVTGLGATEPGIVLHQRLPPLPRTRGSVGDPVACDVRLVDTRGRPVGPGEIGELQVRGPQVFDGYVDDPALDAASFVEGWFRLGDLARADDRGDYYIVGRTSELINRGGEKLAPLEIDAALRAIAGVADAAAFGVPHPRLGQEVVAAIVRRPGAIVSVEEVQSRVRATLGARRSPRQVWFVDALPRNDAGKILRSALPEWVGYRAPTADAEAPSRDLSALEASLAGLWSAALGVVPIDPDRRYLDEAGHAGRGATLVAQVRTVFGVELSPRSLAEEAGTVAGMARAVERARRTPAA